MSGLTVIVPTRGRPLNAQRLAEAFRDTVELPTTKLVFMLDTDDPTLEKYLSQFSGDVPFEVEVRARQTSTMVEALNRGAQELANGAAVLGFMGDDHRPRTPGWDQMVLTHLKKRRVGLLYGDDKLQGEALPTACFMTSNIVTVLGMMAPPMLKHMFVDNFWLDLGRGAECISYSPDIVIEHMHPGAGKVVADDHYGRVNAYHGPDEVAYQKYKESRLRGDVLAIRNLQTMLEWVR